MLGGRDTWTRTWRLRSARPATCRSCSRTRNIWTGGPSGRADVGGFYLLMIYSDPLHLVGPFPDHRHAFSWAVAYQARTDDEGWQVLWLEDPTAPVPLLSPAEGVAEAARRDEAWRRVVRQ